MQLPMTEARAFVFGPPELAELIAAQFRKLGIAAETAKTPLTDAELFSWLSAHVSDVSTFVHPGLSFWAERPEFPQLVTDSGFFPVSPTARSLSLCLNKLNVLIEAEAAGISHLAISLDPLSSLREIEGLLEKTGETFPIVLRSLKVAHGHGIQVILNLSELRETVPIWFEQLTRRYGEASVIVEKCLASARHVVVPFAADGSRFLEIFPLIDASLQTRWRRMIQFLPASGLGTEVETEIRSAIRKWVSHLNFQGFGSLEFLVDGERVYLIDALPRLNAAFPLWEEITGASSLEWQLAGLGQLPLPGPAAVNPRWGAGISLRFYAEDPVRQVPCPGLIREITAPFCDRDGDSETLWMTRFVPGQSVAWTSTGVIGELFVFAEDREKVILAARKAIRGIWIAGSLQTNRRFLLEHVEHPFVKENLIHAGFTDEDFVPEGFPDEETVQTAVSLAESFFPAANARWAFERRWFKADPDKIPRLKRREEFMGMGNLGHGVSGETEAGVKFLMEPSQPGRWLVHFDSWTFSLRRIIGSPVKEAPTKRRSILALAPGRIHALLRHPGEVLAPRDRACMLESIGILVPHAVPVAVRLLEWKVVPGQVVEVGHELAVFELIS